jgi:hypothetical protein
MTELSLADQKEISPGSRRIRKEWSSLVSVAALTSPLRIHAADTLLPRGAGYAMTCVFLLPALPPETPAARPLGLGTSFIDVQRPSFHILAVHGVSRLRARREQRWPTKDGEFFEKLRPYLETRQLQPV